MILAASRRVRVFAYPQPADLRKDYVVAGDRGEVLLPWDFAARAVAR